MQQWVRYSAKVAAGILSAWFLLLPVTANALGLGNIKMESALNQPLNAEIELLSATPDDLKGLEVKLASRVQVSIVPDCYRRSNSIPPSVVENTTSFSRRSRQSASLS